MVPEFSAGQAFMLAASDEAIVARKASAKAELSTADYRTFLEKETKTAIRWQEAIGIDVLVHGEFERNDMVHNFGEHLESYVFTSPVTILQWSFVRDDLPRSEVCSQIPLALRDEVTDLEAAGISAIQIEVPALREGLPLRKSD